MLAVAFGPPNMAAACAGLQRIREVADCLELRLDLFEEPFDLPTLLQQRGELPVVATLRPPSEGGRSTLAPPERFKVLIKAAELGAEYVDVEWDAASPEALAALRAAGARVIVSRHDFQSMPDLAGDWWPRLAELGGDVVKVVGACGEVRDSLMVLRTLQRATLPTIAIGMGQAGLPTRLLALRSDECLLTYASPDDGQGTAPGQISVTDMHDVYRASKIGPATRAFGLLGPHVEGDRLREYNAWFDADTIDAVAVPFVADSDAAGILEAFRELPVSGWHIHGGDLQRDVVRVLDGLDATAARQAKVNAVVCRPDGALVGYWVESPREQYELWRGA
jgi:3-dehydroquinate dehydratase / shikimate dehydrogenase